MPVEKTTPQLVKKGKGKKRPGYRGPGEYQGGRGYGGSKSSKGGDKGTGGSKGNLGGGGGGQNTSYRRYSPPTKKTYTSKTIDSKPVTGKDYRDSRDDFVNTLNRNNQIAAERAGTRFTPYQGGARMQRSNPLSGLLKLAAGFAFPGLGPLMFAGGKLKDRLIGLNDSIQNSDFGRSKNLMDYRDIKSFGGYNEREMARQINKDEAKNLQARIDAGEFGGFGIQTPTQTFSFDNSGMKTKSNFSDPFKNTVGTTTKVNAPASDAVSSVTPETGFFENQFNKFFSGPEFDAYNAVRTDKYANAPSKFDYDFNTNKAAMQMINDKITNNAKGTIFEGLPSELASVVGNIAAVPGSIPASLAHEFVQSRERVQDQFKGASPSIMAEGPSIGDYYSGFMNENPFATAGTRALGIGAALPDALGKVGKTISDAFISPAASAETVPTTTEDITIDGGMLNSPFMENQIGPRVIAAENAYYNQGKMPPEFLGDRIRMNMELGNARGFMGPGFADGGIASMFTRRG